MYVVDTRPKINAIANRAQGKGYEDENNYSNIKFYFFGIENIHVMRSSLQKLLEGSNFVLQEKKKQKQKDGPRQPGTVFVAIQT
jgi:hypothetical protein